jgi:Na+/melibiose symporter-like transporter
MYVGFAAGMALGFAPVIVGGMVGSAVAFSLVLRGKLRPWVIVATGAVFAIATFLLWGPAIRLVGELAWLIGVVVIAGVLSYAAALLFSPRAA